MARPVIRVLVVDDYEPFRRFARSTISERPQFQIVGESSDGLDAVRSAAELKPDLVLLDIGLPKLNGIEAARRIRKQSPNSRILFFSENRSSQIIEEALRTGAGGYLLKADAGRELFVAMEAVLQGKPFVSSSLSGHSETEQKSSSPSPKVGGPSRRHSEQIVGRHELLLYSHDWQLVDAVSQFLGAALDAGNAAVVIATDSHRDNLIQKLHTNNRDISSAIEQGRYISLDAVDTFSPCIVNGMLEPNRFLESFRQLILQAASAATGEHPRVAIFGECSDLMCKQGHANSAIQDEKLCNQLCKTYAVDILCGCSLRDVQGGVGGEIFQSICAEHSAIHRHESFL
jgi:DNA-binding NarL/FixJ family response regulator